MTEEEYLKSNIKIEDISRSEAASQTPLPENADIIADLKTVKQELTSVPTFTPQGFINQIQLYNGKLYVYINGNWVTPIWTAPTGLQTATGIYSKATSEGTGEQTFTIGFQPKLIEITAVAGGDYGGQSWGAGTSTSAFNNLHRFYDSYWQTEANSNYIIQAYNNGATQAGRATLSAVGATSFTLNWTDIGVLTKIIWKVIG